MAFDLGSAIGPVNCRIRMRDDGTITCETHGDVFQNVDETKAHIKEKNVEWHHQQDALDAIRRAYEQAQAVEAAAPEVRVTPDWVELAKGGPEKFIPAAMKWIEEQARNLPVPPLPPVPPAVVGGVYHLHFEDGDVMDVIFHAATFEELQEKMLRAREVFRA